jgi:hypothetical protein
MSYRPLMNDRNALPTHSFRRVLYGFAVLFGFLLGVPAAKAQFDTATVIGRVTDPSGSVVRNATVALHNIDLGTTLTRKSNSSGEYEFPDVQVGSYTVSVISPGFAESVTDPFDLVVSARTQIDVKLRLGNVTESVTVSVDNAGLQSQSGERSTTIESEQILDLPLNGREYSDLALLTPGVADSQMDDGTVTARRGSFNVNANRAGFNNFLLDGLDNNSYQIGTQGFSNQAVVESVDGVQQFTIQTSNYQAEFGRVAGAVVNVKTRSGSDKLHFTLFEFLRNTALNAYGPFPGNGIKPGLIQNQFGGSIGYKFPEVKDFFFFMDYEAFRQASHLYYTAVLPTAQQISGTFMANTACSPSPCTGPLHNVPIQNPITGKEYDGVIPASDITPFAAAVLAALPATPNGNGQFQAIEAGHNYRDVFDIRLDKYIGNRLTTFVRFSKQSGHLFNQPTITGPAGGEGNGHSRILTTSGAAGATYVLTPNSLLDFRLGIIFANTGQVPYNTGVPNFYAPFNIPYPVDPRLPPSGLNTQAISFFTTMGGQGLSFTNPNTYNVKTNYTLAKGKHSFAFGYEWMMLREKVEQGSTVLGSDSYAGEFSALPPNSSTTSSANTTGDSTSFTNNTLLKQDYTLADFMFGARSEYKLSTYGAPVEYYIYNYGYAQDSWRTLPNLTLTYGLRYEFATPERSATPGAPIENFDPNTNSILIAKPGTLYDQALVHPKLDNFGPRFGFAYSLYPNIVFRGGYAISYIEFNRGGSELLNQGPNIVNGDVKQTPPTYKTPQALCPVASQSLTCFRPTMQGYPTSLTSPALFSPLTTTTSYVPPHSAPAYSQSYSFGTQVQIDKATILNIGYVGVHDVHLQVEADYNEAAAQQPYQTLSVAARSPIKTFSSINEWVPLGFLRTNSLQTQITHRARGGLYFIDSFTWSKAFDNAAGPFEGYHGDSQYVDLHNLSYTTGISSLNQALNNSLGLTWKIPFGEGISNKPLRQAAAGWTITTITRMTTGQPMNIYYSPSSTDVVSGLGLTYRPNYTGPISKLMNPRSQWVNMNGGTYLGSDGQMHSCTGYCNVFNWGAITPPNGSNPTGGVQGGLTPSGPYGNLPRNALTSPNYWNIDLGLQKNFALPERMHLQFRIEAFNVLNHTNFRAPNDDRSSSVFGQNGPGSTYSSRQMQAAFRLNY